VRVAVSSMSLVAMSALRSAVGVIIKALVW